MAREVPRACGFFFRAAGWILLVTASAKLVSSFGHARALAVAEPISGFSFRWVLLGVAAVELAVAVLCLRSEDFRLQTLIVAWLATSFMAYRLGLALLGYTGPCGCMGHITDALHLPSQQVDSVMKGILAFLLLGSYSSAVWLWRQGGASLRWR
jgi:hypothetical protein